MKAESPQSGKAAEADLAQAYYQFMDRQHPDNYRASEVAALRQAIRARENRLVLGLPGMGVSNLLRFLVSRAELVAEGVIFVYLNGDTLEIGPDFEPLFVAIAAELSKQGIGDAAGQSPQGFNDLRAMLTRNGGESTQRLIVVIDQTDQLVMAADQRFYRQLKALTDLNKRVCYIFAAGAQLAELIDPENLLFAGRRLVVGPLSEQDCMIAITEEENRLGQSFDPVMQTHMARLTGGHPGLLRAISSAVVQEGLDSWEPDTAWITRLLARADIQYRCQKIWQILSPQQQGVLYALTEGQLRNTTALAWLQQLGLALLQQGRYRLFSPVFEAFIAAQGEDLTPESVALTGGKVFKGENEVTMRPLEQKLLACLMAEPGRVYTHDEIAWSVWDTAEVTPDMIAGLISQLRSHLGKERIKTHYGRGYEFISRG